MLPLIELLAVITSGIYGILLARKKEMDFVGLFSIAFATSFGCFWIVIRYSGSKKTTTPSSSSVLPLWHRF